jgi:hypothetical protein
VDEKFNGTSPGGEQTTELAFIIVRAGLFWFLRTLPSHEAL